MVTKGFQIRGRNFYPIDTKLGTQVVLVKIQVNFEDGLCGSHKDP